MNPEKAKDILSRMRQLEIRTRRLVNDSLAGEYHSVFKGRGMDFDEVREYVAGDEMRTIDWNVTARAGRPFVKKFTEERELTILLLVDVSASGDFGSAAKSKRELAAELASVLAFSAIRNSDKVGLILYTDQVELYIPPKKGRRHVLRVAREILYYQPRGRGTDTVKALDFANHILRRRAIAFLISDFQSSGDPDRALADLRRAMRQTNRRHDLVALHIQDAREKSLPDVGVLAIEDAETDEVVELDTAAPEVRVRFEREVNDRTRQLVRGFAPRRLTRWSWTLLRLICRRCNASSKAGNGGTDEKQIQIEPVARIGLDRGRVGAGEFQWFRAYYCDSGKSGSFRRQQHYPGCQDECPVRGESRSRHCAGR